MRLRTAAIVALGAAVAAVSAFAVLRDDGDAAPPRPWDPGTEHLQCGPGERGEVATKPGRLDEPALAGHTFGGKITNARDEYFDDTPYDDVQVEEVMGTPTDPGAKSHRVVMRRRGKLVGEFRLASTTPDPNNPEWTLWGFLRCVPD